MQELRFWNFANSDPDKPAVIDPGGRIWSRGEIDTAANKLSRALLSENIKRGDILAVVAPNCAEFLIAYFAASQIGLYIVPVNSYLSSREIGYILGDSEPAVIIGHERVSQVISDALNQADNKTALLLSIGNIPGFMEYDKFSESFSPEPQVEPQIGRVMAYTSATTGTPKAVELSLDNAEDALEFLIKFRIDGGLKPEGDVHLLASSIYHAAPLEGVIVTLHMGSVVVLFEGNNAEELLRVIEKYKVTTALMVPTAFINLLNLDESIRKRYITDSLIKVTHTGVGCPPDIKRKMIEWWGPILLEAYGGVEGGGAVVTSTEWLRYPGTVGRPIPGSEIRILDENRNELPPGIVGEIFLSRYTGDCFRYRNAPDKTAECHYGKFFTLGDVGYLNEDGYLFISDRKADMIICGGNNIYCAEVEEVIRLHQSVVDCAIFGVPHEMLGEVAYAAVQLKDNCNSHDEVTSDLRKILTENLALWKKPMGFYYVNQLPRNELGKINRRKLRDAYN